MKEVMTVTITERMEEIGESLFQKARIDSRRLYLVPWDDQWYLRRAKAREALKIFGTKDEAIDFAKNILDKGDASALVVYNRDAVRTDFISADQWSTSCQSR